jgi:hypothetical protein
MPFLSLPETPVPFSTQKAELDGVSYLVKIEWNMRSGWYLGLSDAAGNVIFQPKKLVADWDILRSVTDSRRPPGKLALIDISGRGLEATYDGLGSTHKIAYLSLEEIAALRA